MAAIETAFIAPIAVDQEQWPCHLKLLLQHCPWKYSTRSDRFFRHFSHFNRQAAKQKEINDVVSKCVVNTPDSEIYRGVCLSAINGFCPSTIKRSQNLSHISKAEEIIFWDGF